MTTHEIKITQTRLGNIRTVEYNGEVWENWRLITDKETETVTIFPAVSKNHADAIIEPLISGMINAKDEFPDVCRHIDPYENTDWDHW